MRRFFTHRPLRYLLVGAWNTVFGVSAFTALYLELGQKLGYAAVLAIAQVVAVIQAHASQRLLVWRSHGGYLGELARFSVVYVATYGLNVGLLALAVEVMGLPVLLSQFGLAAILLVPAYLAQRGWAFASESRSLRTPRFSPVGGKSS